MEDLFNLITRRYEVVVYLASPLEAPLEPVQLVLIDMFKHFRVFVYKINAFSRQNGVKIYVISRCTTTGNKTQLVEERLQWLVLWPK